jgi:hypothetical protein
MRQHPKFERSAILLARVMESTRERARTRRYVEPVVIDAVANSARFSLSHRSDPQAGTHPTHECGGASATVGQYKEPVGQWWVATHESGGG